MWEGYQKVGNTGSLGLQGDGMNLNKEFVGLFPPFLRGWRI